MAHLDTTFSDFSDNLSVLARGSDLPMDVEVSGTLIKNVQSHFIEKGLIFTDAEPRVAVRYFWFVIVGGVHVHASIDNLMQLHKNGIIPSASSLF